MSKGELANPRQRLLQPARSIWGKEPLRGRQEVIRTAPIDPEVGPLAKVRLRLYPVALHEPDVDASRSTGRAGVRPAVTSSTDRLDALRIDRQYEDVSSRHRGLLLVAGIGLLGIVLLAAG